MDLLQRYARFMQTEPSLELQSAFLVGASGALLSQEAASGQSVEDVVSEQLSAIHNRLAEVREKGGEVKIKDLFADFLYNHPNTCVRTFIAGATAYAMAQKGNQPAIDIMAQLQEIGGL